MIGGCAVLAHCGGGVAQKPDDWTVSCAGETCQHLVSSPQCLSACVSAESCIPKISKLVVNGGDDLCDVNG